MKRRKRRQEESRTGGGGLGEENPSHTYFFSHCSGLGFFDYGRRI